jgi:hypothetical protein
MARIAHALFIAKERPEPLVEINQTYTNHFRKLANLSLCPVTWGGGLG